MAECHPVGFQWVMEAKARGAKVIHIDPRFTRTSAVADQHVPIRVGSDIAFLGGVVNHILANDLDFREYVVAYTNAANIVGKDFVDTEDLDGLFSGYDADTATYDKASWAFEGAQAEGDGSGQHELVEGDQGGGHFDPSQVRRDPTLQDPRCVFQVLKRHSARYTPEVVHEVCGVPPEQFLAVCEAVTANSGRERTTAWVYSVGWTHHSTGVQYIRGSAIIQLLLGNMGRPGGGILALRGHASIQGSTDIPTLFNLLPGYLPMPVLGTHDSLADWTGSMSTPGQKGFWAGGEAYGVSLLKSWYGEAATAENDYCYGHLPRLTGDHSTYQTVLGQVDGTVEGYFLVGQNPAVGSAQAKLHRMGLAGLKWLVVRDINLIESATFWQDAPEIATGELRTEDIATEVFFLPAATHTEKAGSFTQTQRMIQWRHKAVNPPGDAESELDFYVRLGEKLRDRLAASGDPKDRPLLDLTWDYPLDEHGEVVPESVLSEINGSHLTGERAGQPLSSYTEMRSDGSTAGGCWIYTGIYADGVNQAARRKPGGEQDWVAAEWGWVWPANRRTLYNRASADPEGRPWSERKAYVWWDEAAQEWTGHDVPDFEKHKPPSYRPAPGATGVEALAGDDPFVMQADGKGWLYAPTGLLDGPMPAHYEPHESPVRNPLYLQQGNPTREVIKRADNLSNPSAGEPGVEVFPYVFTTYRLTEHHTAGGMSRWVPYLSELMPEMFCEISPELAQERGIEHLGWATITSARTAIEARVLVTERMTPLRVGGAVVHQVGLPYHWGVGNEAFVSGDSANDLLGLALDANTHIQESKVGSCDIQPGRRPTGPALLDYVQAYRTRAGITTETGNTHLTGPRRST